MNKTEPWRQHLLKAADYIEKYGWCQGKMQKTTGEVCALGALIIVNNHKTAVDSFTSAQHEFERRKRLKRSGITVWNDEPGRTKEQVIKSMRRIAAGR